MYTMTPVYTIVCVQYDTSWYHYLCAWWHQVAPLYICTPSQQCTQLSLLVIPPVDTTVCVHCDTYWHQYLCALWHLLTLLSVCTVTPDGTSICVHCDTSWHHYLCALWHILTPVSVCNMTPVDTTIYVYCGTHWHLLIYYLCTLWYKLTHTVYSLSTTKWHYNCLHTNLITNWSLLPAVLNMTSILDIIRLLSWRVLMWGDTNSLLITFTHKSWHSPSVPTFWQFIYPPQRWMPLLGAVTKPGDCGFKHMIESNQWLIKFILVAS